MKTTIGILGLGPMGGIIATNLLARGFWSWVMTFGHSADANLRPMVGLAQMAWWSIAVTRRFLIWSIRYWVTGRSCI